MKIGFNVKKIYNNLAMAIENLMNAFGITIGDLETRVTTLENSGGGSEWVEITSTNGQEAEITQEFSEIRMLAKTFGGNYTVTVPYDNIIFHNNSSNAPTYIIAGNPIENNYGCKFKYMVVDNKEYVCVDSCFSGGSQEGIEFRAWIR